MSNHVQFVISCHNDGDNVGYRILADDGKMYIKTQHEVSCMINGDTAIREFDPNEIEGDLRSEPPTEQLGPKKNDVIRVLIEAVFCVCTVLSTRTYRGRPLYRVQYDDGMILEDHLNVPWTYVSVAQEDAASSTSALDTLTSVAGTISTNTITTPSEQPASNPTHTGLSSKALGKRRMNVESEPSSTGKRRMDAASRATDAPALPESTGPDVIAAYDYIEAIADINGAMSRESKYMTCLRMF